MVQYYILNENIEVTRYQKYCVEPTKAKDALLCGSTRCQTKLRRIEWIESRVKYASLHIDNWYSYQLYTLILGYIISNNEH